MQYALEIHHLKAYFVSTFFFLIVVFYNFTTLHLLIRFSISFFLFLLFARLWESPVKFLNYILCPEIIETNGKIKINTTRFVFSCHCIATFWMRIPLERAAFDTYLSFYFETLKNFFCISLKFDNISWGICNLHSAYKIPA